MRIAIRLGLLTIAVLSCAAAFAACEDDDGEDSASTPVATIPASTPPAPSASPTVPPRSPVPGTPGPAATIELTAEPQRLTCDGAQTSTITARVADEDGRPVDDGTMVNFSVVTLGAINPINVATTGGVATSVLTPLAEGGGVVVNVSAGDAAEGIRVDCE
jgi:hypothetical protein